MEWHNPPGFSVKESCWSMWSDVNPKMFWSLERSEELHVGDKVYYAKLYQLPKCRPQGGDLWDCVDIMEFNEDCTRYRSAWANVDKKWVDTWRIMF